MKRKVLENLDFMVTIEHKKKSILSNFTANKGGEYG